MFQSLWDIPSFILRFLYVTVINKKWIYIYYCNPLRLRANFSDIDSIGWEILLKSEWLWTNCLPVHA